VKDRIPYVPIVDRPPLRLPGGARVAVWVIVNVEEWDIDRPLPRTLLPPPGGGSYLPDVTNYGWYDYGLRVGFWRLREVLDRYGIRATLSLNGSVCESYPQIVRAARESRWEVLAHGYRQRPMHLEEDEAAAIRRTVEAIRAATGTAPRGWMGPGLTETWNTLDLLAEAGIEYVADWANDDQPYEIRVRSGRLVALPYSLELNDIPMFLVQHHAAEEWVRRVRDQFETLDSEGEATARVMAIAVHPYITGVPHRIRSFERVCQYLRGQRSVLLWTGSEILDWYTGAAATARASSP
jgi:peptidoglycan/xylan/chitin deacetylase (PgdA/CDA1 family)